LALANAGLILVVYGGLGLLGLWLARRLGLPGIYRPEAGAKAWFLRPLLTGVVVGLVVCGVDLAAQALGAEAIAHPPFPASILASFTAGIGEEVLFRLLMMSLYAAALLWVFRRFGGGERSTSAALWIANGLAALAFAAGHLGTAMLLTGAGSPAELPPLLLAEMIALNGLLGLVAGRAFQREGLVAAVGIHFWADVVWHVLYGLL
jgi:hypothetical protein